MIIVSRTYARIDHRIIPLNIFGQQELLFILSLRFDQTDI